MDKQEEIWRDVIGYEGMYQISNIGRVKSFYKKGRILKPRDDNRGYYSVNLSKDKIHKNRSIHVLVAMAFLGHIPCGFKLVVNHIDGNKLNNTVDNLEIVTNRQNSSTCFKVNIEKLTSQYTGVCWHKNKRKWESGIRINGKVTHLGHFEIEEEASMAYQAALRHVNNGTHEEYLKSIRKTFSSKYRGVSFDKIRNKWIASIQINGKKNTIGRFSSELDASNAYQSALIQSCMIGANYAHPRFYSLDTTS